MSDKREEVGSNVERVRLAAEDPASSAGADGGSTPPPVSSRIHWPRRPRPTARAISEKIRAYHAKDGNGAGGSLHIVLDDGNLEDECVQHCYDYARSRGDGDGAMLALDLLVMTRTQRSRAIALSWRTDTRSSLRNVKENET